MEVNGSENALAHYDMAKITTEKSFKKQPLVVDNLIGQVFKSMLKCQMLIACPQPLLELKTRPRYGRVY